MKELDYEIDVVYELKVIVIDGGSLLLIGEVCVCIVVEDVNDNLF